MPRSNYLEGNVSECKNNFNGMIDHPYIEKYVERPMIDEDKVRFIYSMLSRFLPEKEIEVYALSALLVDASLDTHEKVSLSNINSDQIKKNRQLTVLGGDYYSSLYYHLLSQNGNVSMIKVFTYSIQEINEHKMNIYINESLSYSEVKESISSIESILLQNIAEHYKLYDWIQVIREFFFLKRLLNEKSQWSYGSTTPIIRSICNEKSNSMDSMDYKQIQFACNVKIEESKDLILKYMQSLDLNTTFIDDYIEQYVIPNSYTEKVAEEG